MDAVIEMVTTQACDLLKPLWLELSFMVFFIMGFLTLSLLNSKSPSKGDKKTKVDEARNTLCNTIETEVGAGHIESALASWRANKDHCPLTLDCLKLIVQALLNSSPEVLVDEIIGHIQTHTWVLRNTKVSVAVLDVVARAGKVELMEELLQHFKHNLDIKPNFQVYEVLLGGYASAGSEQKVRQLCEELRAQGQKLTARSYSLIIKGFLKNSLVDAALKYIKEMHLEGFNVPPFAITQLCREVCNAGQSSQVLDIVQAGLLLPSDAVTVILEDCLKRRDVDLARGVERIARDSLSSLSIGTYDPLLKIYISVSDLHVLELFEEMQQSGICISESLCVGLIAKCAEVKFLRFAETVVSYVRSQNMMTIVVYSALMKVYAYLGMYAKACDLYYEIVKQGLEPDSIMYGCLIKFSVECGRTDLSQELFKKAPSLQIQNYMSLIRAAGHDKDVNQAFAVLQKLKDSGAALDLAVYNCVLDACVSAGDIERARALIEELKQAGSMDIITYNTLLKGYCAKRDLHGAKEILRDIADAGLQPNDISYNCIINAAVSAGKFHEAWETINMMECNGIAPDHYTLSIMMKALKKVNNHHDVDRALRLLDKSGISVCSDEVLLNSILETCVKHRELQRLEAYVTSYKNSGMKPSPHTYGSLIKACSTLNQIDSCVAFWHEMVESRGMAPNDIVLGCMLDAFVCNNQIEAAVTLFDTWKNKVQANTVMYSTLIKGFANSLQAGRAMEMWHDMVANKVPMNTVVYNALIDSQARMQKTDEVLILVESMESAGCVPDAITYSTIVKCYCYKGELDKAIEVCEGMRQGKLNLNAVVYNTILDGCTRHNRLDLADKVLENMEKCKVLPTNYTAGILVKMYARQRQLDKAFETVENFRTCHGLVPNSHVITALMQACLTNKAINRAFDVFEEMKAGGQVPDSKAYGTLISGCVRNNRLREAVALVEEAYGLGEVQGGQSTSRKLPADQQIDSQHLEQLMSTLAAEKMHQTVGVTLLEKLRAAKVPISSRVLSSLHR